MKFLYGVLIGLAVGVLAPGPGAGPSPRRVVPREGAHRAAPSAPLADEIREEATTPPKPATAAAAKRSSERTEERIAALLRSDHYTDALRAADLLARVGRDISQLSWAFDEAVFRIDRHRAGEPGAEVIEALKAVCRNRVAWRREALEAARALAERSRHEVQVCARDTVEHLRTRVVLAVDR